MTTPNANAFPSTDVEHIAFAAPVGGARSKYRWFDYLSKEAMLNTGLSEHGVNIEEAAAAHAGKSKYIGPEVINDPLTSSMATYRWRNASDPHTQDYPSLYHLKCWLAEGLKQAIEMWHDSRRGGTTPEYKVGIEVKAVFKKNHMELSGPAALPMEEKRV